MLNLENVDHVGIRISDKVKSVNFYQNLGFELLVDGGFEQGHPLVMLHPSGININLLGPANKGAGHNILMDEKDVKYPGITHIALKVKNALETENYILQQNITITGRRDFEGTKTIFIRDPDRNVIELVGEGRPAAHLIKQHIDKLSQN